MSEDKTIDQSITVGGRAIKYKATVGHIPVRDEKGKEIDGDQLMALIGQALAGELAA